MWGFGKGLKGYRYKKNLILNAGNSGTTARLLCAAIIDAYHNIKIIGDRSLNKRDMGRIIKPLSKFGAKFIDNKKNYHFLLKDLKFLNQSHITKI